MSRLARRSVVRAFLVNLPVAAFRLAVLGLGLGAALFAWRLFEGEDPEGALLACGVAILLLIVATGGD